MFVLTKMKYPMLILLLLAVVADVSARRGKPGKRRGHHANTKECIPPVQNCKECQYGYDCTQCENGFKRVEMPLGHACWSHCPVWFIQDGDTCSMKRPDCSVGNCSKCTTNGRCKRCSSGFFLIGSAKRRGPTKCVANCPEGFVPHTPPLLAPHCVEEGCSDASCITCQRGWYRVRFSHKKCHSKCPAGTTPIAGQCIRCPKNCQKCASTLSCAACEKGYALLAPEFERSRCVSNCPSRFKQVANSEGGVKCVNRKCEVENCELCSAGTSPSYKCTKCKTDFHKFSSYYEDICLSQCPDGYNSARGPSGGSECRKGELPITDEPVTSSEPTPEPETTAWTETSTTTDPFTEPEYTTPTDVTTQPEPSTSTEISTTSDFEPTTTAEQTTTPEPTSEWEWTTSAEPSTEPESTTASPEPTTEPEVIITDDSATIEAITAKPTTELDEGDWP